MDNYEINQSHIFGSLFWVIVGCLVGYLIGRSKNRPLVGFLLGFFLGCIGWIIMLFIPKKVTGLTEGWHPDPYGRHQRRYFNGVTWQAQVSDNGVQGIDEITNLNPPPAPPSQ